MPNPVRYRSTNNRLEPHTLGQALLVGQAPDRGLFMPQPLPRLTSDDLRAMQGMSYPDVAHAILSRYVGDEFSSEELHQICADAYDFEVPLEKVHGRRYLLRLDQSATASFKDFAARWMGRTLGRLVRPGEEPLVILTATSGDTGSAVAQAFANVPGIEMVVLFPVAEVSDRQRKQMTTIGGNVTTIGVEGKFDDCQAMVKQAFSDPLLSAIRLSSANSINIGRVLPQSVYYVYAYLQLADVEAGEKAIFCVPCGNFGNLCGGMLARHGGLPVERFVVATNANDEVPVFFDTHVYNKIVPSHVCISNAMNVGHPSNLARLVDLYGGHLDESGVLHKLPEMDRLLTDVWGISIDDAETRRTIVETWERHQVMLEPHGAVAWAGLNRYFEEEGVDQDTLAISLETAHPAKFPEEIRSLIGVDPELPPSLSRIESLEEEYETIPVDYEIFRDLLVTSHGQRNEQ